MPCIKEIPNGLKPKFVVWNFGGIIFDMFLFGLCSSLFSAKFLRGGFFFSLKTTKTQQNEGKKRLLIRFFLNERGRTVKKLLKKTSLHLL